MIGVPGLDRTHHWRGGLAKSSSLGLGRVGGGEVYREGDETGMSRLGRAVS